MPSPGDIFTYEDAQRVVTELADKAYEGISIENPKDPDSVGNLILSTILKDLAHTLADENLVRSLVRRYYEREDKKEE
jgi:hypothetical protein